MAVMTDDFGGRGGLIPFSNNNLTTQTNQSKQIASRELGEIIVKSFETVTEAFEKGDVPVNSKDIESAIVKGINKSDLSKNISKSSSGKGSSVQSSAVDKFYQEKLKDYLEQKKKREEKEAKQQKAEELKKYEENADKILQEINKSVSNPLKGFSNTLDKGVKKMFVGIQQVWNKPINEVGKDLKKGVGKILSPFATVGKGIESAVTTTAAIAKVVKSGTTQSSSSQVDMDELIQEDESTGSAKGEVVSKPATKSEMDELIQEDEEREKKEDTQAKDQLDATDAVNASVGEVVTKVGMTVLALGTIAALLPLAITEVEKIFENSKYSRAELKASISNFFTGPYSIAKQAEIALGKILEKVHFPGFSFNKLSGSEKKEYKELEKRQAIAETARSNLVSSAESTTRFAQRGGYKKVQELLESKDLTNVEDIQSAIDALEDPNQKLIANDMDRRHIINMLKQTKANVDVFDEKKLSDKESQRLQELTTLANSGYDDAYIEDLKKQQENELKVKKAKAVAELVHNQYEYDAALSRADQQGYGNELRLELQAQQKFRENLSSELTDRQATIVAGENYKQAAGQVFVNLRNNVIGGGRPTSTVVPN